MTEKEYYSDTTMITNSMLGKLKKSPQHLQMYLDGKQEETQALNFGSAFHLAILEPEKAEEQIAVYPGKTRRGKEWDAFKEENHDKIVLSMSEYETLAGMRMSISSNEEVMEIIRQSDKEVVAKWVDEETGISCKGRADMVGKNFVADLKTTQNVELEAFRYSCLKYGYNRQAAFYLDGFGKEEFHFICVEKEAPYRIGLFSTSESFINSGRVEYKRLLEEYTHYFVENPVEIEDYIIQGEL